MPAANKFLLASLLALATTSGFAQHVVYTAGLDLAGPLQSAPAASAQDSSGNILITGNAGALVLTQKITPAGVLTYSNVFLDPPSNTCHPLFVASNSSGIVFVAGTLSNPDSGASGVFLQSIGATGTTAWVVKDTTHPNVRGLAIAADGSPILALDRQTGSQSGVRNFDLSKYNPASGVVTWRKMQSYDTIGTSATALASDGKGHTYAVVYRQALNMNSLFAYNEATGLYSWQKPVTLYSPFSSLTPRQLLVLPSGDALVCSDGTNQVWGTANIDRFKASDGSFVFRKYAGSTSGKNRYTMSGPPSTDAQGNIYFSIAYTNGTTFVGSAYGAKFSAAGVQQWLVPIPNTSSRTGWAGAASGPSGGGYYATGLLSGSAVTSISSAGKVLWSKLQPNLILGFAPLIFSAGASAANVFIAGNGYDSPGNGVYQLLNLNSSGAVVFDYHSSRTGYMSGAFEQGVADTAGNTYLAGYQGLFIHVSKYSPAGALLWTRQITPSQPTWIGSALAITWSPRGEVAVAAQINGASATSYSELGLIKLNATTGATLWSQDISRGYKRYYGYFIQEDSLGNVIVGGQVQAATGELWAVASKFASATGVIVWEKLDKTVSYFDGMCLDNKDAVILAAADTGASGGTYKVTKYSATGVLAFTHSNASADTAGYNAVSVDASDNIYESCEDVSSVQVLKLGPTGVVAFTKKFTTAALFASDCESIYDVAHGTLNVMVTGYLYAGDTTTTVLRVNATSGAQMWASAFDRGVIPYNPAQGPGYMYWCIDSVGNVILTGINPKTAQHPSDILVRKLIAATGLPLWTYTFAGKFASSQDGLKGIIVGPDKEPVVFGTTPSPYGPDESEAFLVKLKD